jgi:hypothetical protein
VNKSYMHRPPRNDWVMGQPLACDNNVRRQETDIMESTHYDYVNQCWIVNGRIESCNHPETMNCKCYGKLHAGETASVSDTSYCSNLAFPRDGEFQLSRYLRGCKHLNRKD